MESTLIVLLIAVVAVVAALGIAWLPARMILLAVGRSVGEHVREFVRRSRDRRSRPRGTPDRRSAPSGDHKPD
jgi:hypothetical protein